MIRINTLEERIGNMEILNGGPLTCEQKDIVVNYRMTIIIPDKLFLGSLSDAWDYSQIKDNKITHIIQLLFDVSDFPQFEGIIYHHISLCDDGLEDILPIFKEYIPIIDDILKNGGRILIHCALGVSRSASLCVAYMAHHTGKSINEVIQSIKRPINPNVGFRKALETFVKDGYF